MQIKQLRLFHFRNYGYAHFEFHPGINIFFGENAHGKTNVLEAIYFLATLQSFRISESKGLIQWGHPEAYLEGLFLRETFDKKLSVLINMERQSPQINGKMIRKSADYFGSVQVICFHPPDMQILQGAPNLRRQYLDRAIFNFDPIYGVGLGNYYRALLQRNAALRFERGDMVQVWGERLHRLGAKVLLKRLQFIKKLNRLTSCLYREISGFPQQISVRYRSDVLDSTTDGIDEPALFDLLQKKQEQAIDQERKRKRSLVGPHRDDFSVFIMEKDLRYYGSQGEIKSAIMALKLSEREIFEEDKGMHTLFLLDDISSELDDSRRERLFGLLQERKTQIFVTTTGLEDFKRYQKEAALFKIENGQVHRI